MARAVKTDYEIQKLKESGLKHAALYSHIPAIYEEGMTDTDISIELERLSRQMGSLGIFRIFGASMEVFAGSVIAGDNADSPSPYDFAMGGSGINPSLPVGADGTLLKPGMTLMVDLGGNFNRYMTAMTGVVLVQALKTDLATNAHDVSVIMHADVLYLVAARVE